MKLLQYIIAAEILLGGVLLASGVSAQNKPGGTRAAVSPVTLPAAYTNPALNYIRTWDPELPLTDTNVSVLMSKKVREVKQTTQYFDGLGRPLQTVTKGISSAGADLVAPIIYDNFGREAYKYMPYVQRLANTSDGKFKNDPFFSQKLFFRNGVLNPGVAGDSIFYDRIDFETSPLERQLKKFNAGSSWATRPLENQYQVNTVADSVRIWSISTGLPASTGVYAAGELFENVAVDETNNKVIEYKDKNDRVVLRKVQIIAAPGTGHIGWLCMYYIYDDLGKIRFVIPPLAVEAIMRSNWTISTAIANELCFQYQYDDQQRLVVKKVPGADPVYMVYDIRDRLVFTQDGIQRGKTQKEWTATFYDGLNRPLMTAIYTSSSTREMLQAGMNTAGAKTISTISPQKEDLALFADDGSPLYQATKSVTFYDGFESAQDAEFLAQIDAAATDTTVIVASNPLPSISSASLYPLTYTFYDDYSYKGCLPFNSSDPANVQAADTLYPEPFPASFSIMTTGLTTGRKVRVLGTDKWLTKTTYYNNKGQAIQTVSENNVGGRDIETTLYNFSGDVLTSYHRHQHPRSVTPQSTLLTTMTYDHGSRLLTIKKRLNDDISQERTIVSNSYDELGRLKLKKLGVASSGSLLDTLNYTYNVRGWTQSINRTFLNSGNVTSNWFGQELSYDYGFDTSQYNGNIAGVKWKTRSDSAWAYGFSYDRASRLIRADFTQRNGASWAQGQKDFSVQNLSYDANGNIVSMWQKGMIGVSSDVIDQLTYKYGTNSNKLISVTDAKSALTATARLGDFRDGTNSGDDYVYDVNGNLKSDQNKSIASITYNYLNLPEVVAITGKGTITYQYDAAGNKLSKSVVDNTGSPSRTIVTDYLGGFVYKEDSLEFISHEEGRIRPVYKTGEPVAYAYDYFEKDNLGNVRVVLTDQTDLTMYAATMETAAAAKETALFSNVEETRAEKPAGYPEDKTTEKNGFVAKLNAKSGGRKIGPSLVLRVMAGDTIQIKAKAFYKSQGNENNSKAPVEDMLAGLLQAFGGDAATAASHGNVAAANTTPFNADFYNNNYQRLKEKNTGGDQTGRPKAYLNFVLFDDDFKLVEDNSGVRQVKGTPDELQALEVGSMPVTKSGFLYVYTSNESQQDVFFDNVILAVNSGPLLEETHYYPYGLIMDGISKNALKGTNYAENRRKYNGNELQSKEFGDGSGLELYDFNARTYNAQIGRFMQVDPLIEQGGQETMAPYQFSMDNPIRYNDPDGKCPPCAWIATKAAVGFVVGGGVELAAQLVSGKSIKEVDWVDVGVEAIKGGVSGAFPGAGVAVRTSLEVGGEVVKASVDYSIKDKTKTVFDGSKSKTDAVVDLGFGLGVSKGWGMITKKVEKNGAKAVAAAAKNATVAKRAAVAAKQAAYGFIDNSIPGQAATAAAKKATKAVVERKVAVTVAKTAAETSKVLTGAANGSLNDKVKEIINSDSKKTE